MTKSERDYFHTRLVETKKAENTAQEQAHRNAQSKNRGGRAPKVR